MGLTLNHPRLQILLIMRGRRKGGRRGEREGGKGYRGILTFVY
jgi:hypothetical protein